jgi:hypothetical protein
MNIVTKVMVFPQRGKSEKLNSFTRPSTGLKLVLILVENV